MKKVGIIGAGPAGLSAAYLLSKEGYSVDVFEASSQIGGLTKTIELWNQKVDLGPHRFFSTDEKVNNLWHDIADKDFVKVKRLTRIYYNKKFFLYPLRPLDALSKIGILKAAGCILSYLKEKITPVKQDGSFENWVIKYFGRELFETFFKSYSEKLWGLKCKEIDADFAAQRIKKLSLFEAIKNALNDGKNNRHKTLVDEFDYPLYGSGMIYERMGKAIENSGNKLFLQCPVKKVITKDQIAIGIELENGQVNYYDHIISTMPLSILVSRLPEVPQEISKLANSLKFRNTIIVYLEISDKKIFPDNWIYIHERDLKMGRITNFRNWSPGLNGESETTILALEYWCYNEDEIWSDSDQNIIEIAKKELYSTRLINNHEIINSMVYKIHRCYPVYEKGYRGKLEPIESYLSDIQNLHVIGRYGAFKYNNQDHSILMGIKAFENISVNANHNLWEINTDYENYQEA